MLRIREKFRWAVWCEHTEVVEVRGIEVAVAKYGEQSINCHNETEGTPEELLRTAEGEQPIAGLNPAPPNHRNSEVKMQIQYSYYRVPEVPFLVMPKKGKPNLALLYEYRRGFGFLEWDVDVKPYAKGGFVSCSLVGEFWALIGTATCSMSDTFSYKEGRERALLRATNLGLGHELDRGIMYRMDALKLMDDKSKAELLIVLANWAKKKDGITPNTMYFHPETAEIMPKMDGFTTKTSKIIQKNHVWIGFEE